MNLRRFFVPATALVVALLLAGCQITIGPTPTFPPSLAGSVTAQVTTTPTAQATGTLAPGDVRYYRVDVPTARDLLYAEVGGGSGLRVALYTAGGSLRAVSQSPAFFAGSVASLSTAEASDVGAASISVAFPCLGPCAATVPTSSTFYAAVTNTSGGTRAFELFAYTMDETDQNEPNDATASATVLFGAGSDQGAIEVLGDVDTFRYQATAGGDFYVVFTPFDLSLGLVLEIENCEECLVLDGRSGTSVEGLVPGDVLRVRSAANRAGPSATSGYTVEVTATPPLSAVTSR